MNAWFVIGEAWKHDPELGSRIRETAFWNALEPDGWSQSTGTAYRTREEAETTAFYLKAKFMRQIEWLEVVVLSFEGVIGYYGITISQKENE